MEGGEVGRSELDLEGREAQIGGNPFGPSHRKEPDPMEMFSEIVRDIPWFGWIVILAILCGTVTSLVKASQRHQERMAKIKQGIDPDHRNGPP